MLWELIERDLPSDANGVSKLRHISQSLTKLSGSLTERLMSVYGSQPLGCQRQFHKLTAQVRVLPPRPNNTRGYHESRTDTRKPH